MASEVDMSMTDLIDLVVTSSLVSVTLKVGITRLTNLIALKTDTAAVLEAVAHFPSL